MPKDPEEKKPKNEERPADAEAAPAEDQSVSETAAAVSTAEKELAEALAVATKKAEEYLANWQRTQADFTNYRRRTEQEKLDLGKYANERLLCEILPIVDDLELALNHIPAEHAKNDWVEGVKMVARKFQNTLEKQGVKPVCALGMNFDPNLHEALKQDKGKEGMVIAEVQKGYTFHDKLLRPSRVIVGSGEAEEKAAEDPPEKG